MGRPEEHRGEKFRHIAGHDPATLDDVRAPVAAVDGELFRAVVGHFASGVAVITSRDEGVDYGATVSAVSSVSLDPPTMLVCLNTRMGTQVATQRSGAFAVNVLSDGQGDLARRFATPSSDKFNGVRIQRGVLGLPLIEGALAHLECRVREEMSGGTHRIFIGGVHAAHARTGRPLSYFRGTFGRFVRFDEDLVYQRIRMALIARCHEAGSTIGVDEIARETSIDETQIRPALERLHAEGLVAFDSRQQSSIRPVDTTIMQTAIRLRSTIEIGACAELLLQRAPADLTSLERACSATNDLLRRSTELDLSSFIAADQRLHSALVGLAGNSELLATHRAHGLPRVIQWILGSERALIERLHHFNQKLVSAIQAGDLHACSQAIQGHAAVLLDAVGRTIRENTTVI